jgi:hypothetical protein
MNDEFLDKLEELLSKKKVEPYKKKFSNNWFEAYKSELEQAKEIFIYLHFLEIFLRNKIADEFSVEFGNWFFDQNCALKLNFKEQEKIDKAIIELTQTKKEITSDNIVSSLSFGFWTNLFHKSYNYPIWDKNKMIERVFPFLKPHQRNPKQIQKEMEAIRKLRNRVFHFENLQSWNFTEIKKLIDKFIYGVGGFDMISIMQTNHKF